MKMRHFLPLAAMSALVACGGDTNEATSGEALSEDEIATAIDGAQAPRPGLYSARRELVELQVPGVTMDDNMNQMMRDAMETTGETYCVAENDAVDVRRQMLRGMAENNCEVTRLDTGEGKIDAAMRCSGGQGITGDVSLTGMMGADGADMEMMFSAPLPMMGDASVRMRMISERIGDC